MKTRIPKPVKTKTHPIILHTTESNVRNIPEYIGIKEGRVITGSEPLIRDTRDKILPIPDGKLDFTLHTATDIPSSEDRWIASRIQDNYQNAMSRRRDYIFPYVGDGVLAGTYGFKGDDGSLLIDLPGKSMKTHNEIFIPSHFAPRIFKGWS